MTISDAEFRRRFRINQRVFWYLSCLFKVLWRAWAGFTRLSCSELQRVTIICVKYIQKIRPLDHGSLKGLSTCPEAINSLLTHSNSVIKKIVNICFKTWNYTQRDLQYSQTRHCMCTSYFVLLHQTENKHWIKNTRKNSVQCSCCLEI